MARRSLSEPVIYTGKLKALDKMNLKGKFENKDSGKIANIIFANQNDLLQAHPYLAKDTEMVFVGSPLIEFGSRNPTPVMYIF